MAIIKMVLYQPTYSCLLTLNQSPKDNAGSDITNCLTHTSRMTGYAVIVQSRAETYHFFVRLACYLVINPSSNYLIPHPWYDESDLFRDNPMHSCSWTFIG